MDLSNLNVNLPFTAGDVVLVKNYWDSNPKIEYVPGIIQEIILEQTGEEPDGLFEHEVHLLVVMKHFLGNDDKYICVHVPVSAVVGYADRFEMKEVAELDLTKTCYMYPERNNG